MAHINLNLPADLQAFVDQNVEAGDYRQAGEFIESLLIRAKQQQEELESQLAAGLDSGAAIPLDAAQWERIRAEVSSRLANGS